TEIATAGSRPSVIGASVTTGWNSGRVDPCKLKSQVRIVTPCREYMICPLPRENDLTASSRQPGCHHHRGGGDDLHPGCSGAGHEGACYAPSPRPLPDRSRSVGTYGRGGSFDLREGLA